MNKAIMAVAIVSLASCKSNEIGNSKDVSPDAIFQDYLVHAVEGEPTAETNALFRFAGSKGTTLVLDGKSHVTFDGKPLQVDSSATMGAYYRYRLPLPGSGEHQWQFTDINGKTYTNKFKMQAFSLTDNFTKPLGDADLPLHFIGLPENEEVRIYIADTASSGKYHDVDTVLKIRSGMVTVPANLIKHLAPGPIKIDASQEKNELLPETTKEGGSLYYFYRINSKKARLVRK